jgi:hypothetical protein
VNADETLPGTRTRRPLARSRPPPRCCIRGKQQPCSRYRAPCDATLSRSRGNAFRGLLLCASRGSGSVARVTRSDVKHCLRAHGNRRTAEIVQHREGVLPTREHLVEFVHHRLEIPLHVDRSSVHARNATRGHAATLPAVRSNGRAGPKPRKPSLLVVQRGSEQRICRTIARACRPQRPSRRRG